ncbi:4Fe-4S dicluster domain-containing protein, partial [Marinibaculum pumilum]
PEEIVPYAEMPEGAVPGRPRFYATALALTDYATPAVVEAHQGRPTKVEGNARHPASGGASDAFAQAAVLSLYDPDRARAPLRRDAPGQAGAIASWDRLLGELQQRRQDWARDGGAGLRLLTPPVCSPTLAAQIGALLAAYPAARWHAWAPLNEDNARRGAILAFGRPLQLLPDLARARAVLTLDADPLGPGPAQAMLARGWAAARTAPCTAGAADRPFSRLYAVEPAVSLTGAAADHRLALPPDDLTLFAGALAQRLGSGRHGGDDDAAAVRRLPAAARAFLDAVAADLAAAGSAALVLAGPAQPPEVHALALAINRSLGALGRTLSLLEPVQAGPPLLQPSLAALADDMARGDVTDLVVLGGNPAHDAPADLDFAARLSALPFTLRLSVWPDETASLCRWHLPEHHPLETWSDARSVDGRASLVQPLIRPLFDSRSAHEVLAMLQGEPGRQGHAILQAHWRDRLAAGGRADAGAFDSWWKAALRDGVVPGSAAPPVDPESLPAPPPVALPRPAMAASARPGLTLLLRPDPALWDGRFAGNAWLQELPQPFTKLAWGNALQLAPQEMAARGLAEGDLVRLAHDGAVLELPVSALPGLATGTAVLHLGHGRRRAGAVGSGHGTDAYPLRRSGAMWQLDGIALRRTGGRARLPRTQSHFGEAGRDIVREIDLAALAGGTAEPQADPPSLYAAPPVPQGPQAWGMAVDQAACIGCNACVIACQAENNVPVVGPEEMEAGRDMHWLRIDTYFAADTASGSGAARARFQPVPCMHCEKAPCEPVCPVAASVHDRSGLNAQVYNRCIGTRDCQSTCPYQVRRFNFRDYAGADAYANLGDPLYRLQRNPDVSVRSRGVMEKCTYCVQRIAGARQDAEASGRPMRDGDVVTACQAACPTRAIAFGDLNDDGAEVVRRKAQPRNYALLGHLGVRPRTTYLARLRNPHPDLSGGAGDAEGGAE